MSAQRAEGENLGDVVAEGVGGVGAGRIALIDLGCAMRPGDLFEIANEFAATRVDEKVGFAEGVSKSSIDTVYAIANGGVGGI